MKRLLQFLELTKKSFVSDNYQRLHLVLGNESCDLDSTVSPMALAYLFSKNSLLGVPKDALVLPVFNIPYENFPTKTENNFLLNKFNIKTEWLVFRDQIKFEDILARKNVTVSLVDHHILSKTDEILHDSVIHVFDHRPVDPDMNWDSKKVMVKIEEVGSCASLISDIILKNDQQILCYELAYLLYATIVYDTVGLKPENGRMKELDLNIAKKLEDLFKFDKDRDSTFAEVRQAHIDVSHLTVRQLLLRDLKIVCDIPVPGLPMLVEDFLKIDGAYDEVTKFSREYSGGVVVLIGLDTRGEVKRDIAILWMQDCRLKEVLIEKLKKAQELKGYDFEFTPVKTCFNNVICLRQGNVKLSRKQIIPFVKETIVELK
ncbi:exopolyphosphatase PRUNE1 [Aethina tumida]|uniref:exopolyphosphatase PRUNE1 n=1 Tax=Aethina tumida TaxID=116153 RepID=UPI00096B0011|nr:exopolyphosphatase PRUNE1 [Aethina tumida]